MIKSVLNRSVKVFPIEDSMGRGIINVKITLMETVVFQLAQQVNKHEGKKNAKRNIPFLFIEGL